MNNALVVIACGSRYWDDRRLIQVELEAITNSNPDLTIVVEGGALGADRQAGQWAARARQSGTGWLRIPAQWSVHHPDWCYGDWCKQYPRCKAAGPRRNQQMLDYALHADRQYVIAFKDGFDHTMKKGGTEDMVRRAKQAGVHGKIVSHAA